MVKRLQKTQCAPSHDRFAPNLPALRLALGPLTATWQAWLPKVLLIVVATFWIYWPALRGDFIWDDVWYIPTNPLLYNLTGLWKFWFQPGSWVEYYPIEETVLWVQWQLWGNDTLGYHLTNIFLHIASALLVWRLLSKFGLRLAWIGGLIFAVHPAQVESVAYISELKNTLSLFFFLLAMCSWIDYEERKQSRDYRWALGLFLAGMLCKITMAPFPFVILLYSWWKRGRIEWNDLRISAPFFAISLALAFMTIWVGQRYEDTGHGQPDVISMGGFFSRLAGSGLILSFYFSRSFLPVDYLPAYPKWPVNTESPIDYLPWLIVGAGGYWLWKKRKSWGRHALLGLGFFFLTLAPFLGFIAVSYMSFTWVMDHFLYVPIIGLIGLVVAGLGDLEARLPSNHPYATGAITILIALMALESRAVAKLFVNDETLWSYALQRNPDSWIAHYNLGGNLLSQGRYPEALVQLKEAVPLLPDYGDGYYNLGVALDKLGRIPEAQMEYHEAMRLNPGNPKIYLNLGEIEHRAGHTSEAEAFFRQGLKIVPGDASLCIDLGDILVQTGRVAEAIDLYENAAEINPNVAPLQYNLGVVLFRTGNLSEAEEHLAAAVTLDSTIAEAHENLGIALAQLGRVPEAIEQFEAALQLNPKLLAARFDLAVALVQTGHIPEAATQFQKVIEIDPGNAKARDCLTKLQQFEMQQNSPGSH